MLSKSLLLHSQEPTTCLYPKWETTTTGGICRQKRRSTNKYCQNAPTTQDRSTETNKANKGQNSRDNKRKMAREKDTWTIVV